ELDLLCGRQELVAACLVEEQLQRVRRRDGEVAVHVRAFDRVGTGAVVCQRDVSLLELLEESGRLLLVQLRLLEELADGREVEATLLLTLLQERLESLVYHCHAARIPLSARSPNAVSHSHHKDVSHPRQLAPYRGFRSHQEESHASTTLPVARGGSSRDRRRCHRGSGAHVGSRPPARRPSH